MKLRLRPAAALIALLLPALPAAGEAPEAGSGTWSVGQRIEPFALEDQHGEPGRVDEHVRLLLFTADMDAADFVSQALEADPALRDLAARGAVFVSDIHRMPGLITRLFALPAMRRRPYRMLLDREAEGPTRRIPREPGRVTAVHLEDGVVRSLAFLDSADAVAAALGGPPGGG